ncbi:MAG TPA: tetratricopeptide repeat protein, partial [Anaerolineae bacterium]|nr:tetratricopeptide repeat protein [Anaerolineae bacterium]
MISEPPARIEQIRSLCRAGKVAAAYQQARTLLAEARERGEDEAIAEALIALAHVHFRLGQYGRAQALLAEAMSQTPEDHPLQVDALIHLGLCAAETNAPDEAEAYYRRAVDLSRLLGYEEALYRGLHALAVGVYIPRGQFELALAMDQDAYDFIVAHGTPELGWNALAAMGWVYWITGRPHEAAGMAARLRRVSPEGSLPRGFHDALLADLAQDEGRMEEAARLYARARGVATRIGDPGLRVLTHLGASRLMRRLGRWAAARSWADEALAVAQRVGYVHLEGMALLARARASLAADNLPACEADLHQAIDLMTSLRFDFHLAEAWLLLAGLLRRVGRDESDAWSEAAARIQRGRYYFLLERERAIAFPLIARQMR